ncbi:MAG: hypothetical protein QXU32_05910 [Nitrososphaerales archaeon]
MVILKERALVIFEEDVKDPEILKKLKAKIIVQMLPPHRYDGILTVENSLRFEGKELFNRGKFRFDIPISSIVEMHLGFDETFVGKDSKGKKYQLDPIRIRYRDDRDVKTMYVFMEYKGLFRSNSSEECYRILASATNP